MFQINLPSQTLLFVSVSNSMSSIICIAIIKLIKAEINKNGTRVQ